MKIDLVKMEAVVPKVASAFNQLRADKVTLEADNAEKQKKINELEAILFALLAEDGGSMGGVV